MTGRMKSCFIRNPMKGSYFNTIMTRNLKNKRTRL